MLAPIISDPAFYAPYRPYFCCQYLVAPVAVETGAAWRGGGVVLGTIAGFLSFASQGGGLPFQVSTLPQRLSKMTFVGTTAIFFAALNIIEIMPYATLAQFTVKSVSSSLFSCLWQFSRISSEFG
jgi:hypothetical protein